MDSIEDLLRELKKSPSTRWMANEVDETLAQGVSMNVKDAVEDNRFFELMPVNIVQKKENNKRLSYETSRPFTEHEKIEVTLKAFEVIYLDLPAIRSSAVNNLVEFNNNLQSIVFSSADDDLTDREENHKITINKTSEELQYYKEAYSNFLGEIDK